MLLFIFPPRLRFSGASAFSNRVFKCCSRIDITHRNCAITNTIGIAMSSVFLFQPRLQVFANLVSTKKSRNNKRALTRSPKRLHSSAASSNGIRGWISHTEIAEEQTRTGLQTRHLFPTASSNSVLELLLHTEITQILWLGVATMFPKYHDNWRL